MITTRLGLGRSLAGLPTYPVNCKKETGRISCLKMLNCL